MDFQKKEKEKNSKLKNKYYFQKISLNLVTLDSNPKNTDYLS